MGKGGLRERAIFYSSLSLMLRAGIALPEAMEMLIAQESDPRFQAVLQDMVGKVITGCTLSKAMSLWPQHFSALEIHLINAGFESGDISKVTFYLGESLLRQFKLEANLRAALVYPMITLGVCLLIVIFVPPYLFASLFEVAKASGKPLPAISLFFAKFSDFIRTPWAWIGLVSIVGNAAWYLREETRRSWILGQLMFVPVIGPVITETVVLRFCYAWILLMESGQTTYRALAIAGMVTGIKAFEASIERASKVLTQDGGDIVDELDGTGYFSPVIIDTLKTGFETGDVCSLLARVLPLQESLLATRLETLAKLLEPLTLILMGLITGVIAVAALLPLAGLIQDL